MTKPKEIIKKASKDMFGQTVNPGDTVCVITENYGHAIKVRKGTFLGYLESKNWLGRSEKRFKIKTKIERYLYKDKKTGELRNWYDKNLEGFEDDYTPGYYEVDHVTTLQLNRIVKLENQNV